MAVTSNSRLRGIRGRSFVLVGGFSLYQFQVKGLIEEYGGEIQTFITTNTDYILVGNQPSGYMDPKMDYAVKYGTTVIDENDLETMIRAAQVGTAKRQDMLQAALENENYGTW